MKRLAVTLAIVAASPLILAGAFAMWVLVSRDTQPIVWTDDAD